MEGKVKFFNRNKGYGFIQGDDGQDYFVHHSALDEGANLRENDRVSFEVAETDRGRQAQKVTLLQKGSELKEEFKEESEEEPQEELEEEPQEEIKEDTE